MVGRPEPSPGLLRRIDALARATLPIFTSALLLILAAGPMGIPALVPAAALPCVFFWSLFRPGAMPPPAVFALGMLQDIGSTDNLPRFLQQVCVLRSLKQLLACTCCSIALRIMRPACMMQHKPAMH